MGEPEMAYCEKCQRTLARKNFYVSRNLEKYPQGVLRQCKKCISMHVDNWNPDTYLWILQECDVPYIPTEWNSLLAKYAKDPEKMSPMTILGRYLSKMNLKNYLKFHWADTEFCQQMADAKVRSAMEKQGYSEAEIAQEIEKGKIEIPEKIDIPVYDDAAAVGTEIPQPPVAQDTIPEINYDLTDEQKRYFTLKWGKLYKPSEWIWMEKMYEEMMHSYDIQTAGHIDTLKLLCKTSLKANQLIDIGDKP